MKLPTSDLPERLLQNGGRVPPGLFRENQKRALLGGAPPQIDPMDLLVAKLRDMLRDLTNLNVRQPSTLAPPFRAQQFVFQTLLPATNNDPVAIPIGGELIVPAGVRAVVNFVSFTMGPATPTTPTVPDPWGETGANPSTLTILRNGIALPGMLDLLPSMLHGVQAAVGPDFALTYSLVPGVPFIPIALTQGDALAFTNQVTSVGMCYLQVAGYTYPIEEDVDGVRGTLADRG